MSALTLVDKKEPAVLGLSADHIDLIKNNCCKGASDLELQLFLHVCNKVGLDPLCKQIYSLPPFGAGAARVTVVSIDGLRSIAERSKCYAPGKETLFRYDSNGRLQSATAYVKKMTADGTWHEVSAPAYWAEYGSDKGFWKKMPHVMLGKCAEAIALRKAFPLLFSGVFCEDELDQASRKQAPTPPPPEDQIEMIVCEEDVQASLVEFLANFPTEEHTLMQEFLDSYCKHFGKSLWQGVEDHKANLEYFRSRFNMWCQKHGRV